MQKQLDTYIEQNHNLEQTDLFHETYVALLVETGNSASETRCFTFCSTKPRSEREAILEEYVYAIHFILSLAIEKGFTYENVERKPVQRTETKQFIHVFRAC